MERFEYLSALGEGAYGHVWLCKLRDTNQNVAMKRFKEAHTDMEVMRLAMREIKLLKASQHPNVVQLIEAFRSKSGRVYIVMEYVERTLTQDLRKYDRGFPPVLAKMVAWQLLQAVSFLHKKKVIHRDLKPANILLSSDNVVKICDFGFARVMHPRETSDYTTYVVTRWYRPPEVLVNDEYGPKVDVWAIGCLMCEMASGRPMFPGKTSADQLWLTMQTLGPLPARQAGLMAEDSTYDGVKVPGPGQWTPLEQRFPGLPRDLLQVVRGCLALDPSARLTAEQAMAAPYFEDVPQIMMQITAAAAGGHDFWGSVEAAWKVALAGSSSRAGGQAQGQGRPVVQPLAALAVSGRSRSTSMPGPNPAHAPQPQPQQQQQQQQHNGGGAVTGLPALFGSSRMAAPGAGAGPGRHSAEASSSSATSPGGPGGAGGALSPLSGLRPPAHAAVGPRLTAEVLADARHAQVAKVPRLGGGGEGQEGSAVPPSTCVVEASDSSILLLGPGGERRPRTSNAGSLASVATRLSAPLTPLPIQQLRRVLSNANLHANLPRSLSSNQLSLGMRTSSTCLSESSLCHAQSYTPCGTPCATPDRGLGSRQPTSSSLRTLLLDGSRPPSVSGAPPVSRPVSESLFGLPSGSHLGPHPAATTPRASLSSSHATVAPPALAAAAPGSGRRTSELRLQQAAATAGASRLSMHAGTAQHVRSLSITHSASQLDAPRSQLDVPRSSLGHQAGSSMAATLVPSSSDDRSTGSQAHAEARSGAGSPLAGLHRPGAEGGALTTAIVPPAALRAAAAKGPAGGAAGRGAGGAAQPGVAPGAEPQADGSKSQQAAPSKGFFKLFKSRMAHLATALSFGAGGGAATDRPQDRPAD